MTKSLTFTLLASLMCHAYAIELPDLARGIAASQRGDLNAAIADLRPLAERGYLDAQIALAKVYAKRLDPASTAAAIRWYRIALAQDASVRLPLARLLMRTPSQANALEAKALIESASDQERAMVEAMLLKLYRTYPNLVDTRDAPQLAARVAQSPLIEQRREAISWYRQNETVLPEYSRALEALCTRDKEAVPECYAELARIYRANDQTDALAALVKEAGERHLQGLIPADTLERIARELAADEPGTPRRAQAYSLLKQIDAPSPNAKARMGSLLLADPTLDPAVDPEQLLKDAVQAGSTDAMLTLGRLYLDVRSPEADPAEAEKLLTAAAAELPSAHYHLGRLYERGYKGRVAPDQALEHYLSAARSGYTRADLALAQMFSRDRGIKKNPAYAYAFSRVASGNNVVGAAELQQQFEASTAVEALEAGRMLATRELGARQSAGTANEYPTLVADAEAATTELALIAVQPAEPVADFRVKLSGLAEGSRGLGTGTLDATAEAFVDAQASLYWPINPDWALFGRVQAFAPTGELTVNDEGQPRRSSSYLALRQLWVEYGGLTNYPGEYLRLGRQRLREQDGLWVDRDIESLSWTFDTTLVQAQVAVAQAFHTWRTDQSDLPATDRDRLYVLAGFSRQWQPSHFWGVRAAYAADRADPASEHASGILDPKSSKQRYTWLSAYAHNGYFTPEASPARRATWSYWGNVNLLMGNRDDASAASLTTPASTSSTSVNALALDLGLRWALPTTLPWQVGVAYAFGSGSKDGGVDHDFAQTGLHSNRSRYTGTRSYQYRYNEALGAELTNLHVATLYVSLPLERYDASIAYHKFLRHHGDDGVVTNGLNIQPLPGSRDLGDGLDIVLAHYFGTRAARLAQNEDDLRANVRLRASVFRPGDAYASGADLQYRVSLEATLWF